jgi:hypothetical protein
VEVIAKTLVYLLDFGLCERFMSKDQKHVEIGTVSRELGNKFFMSLDQLN